MPWRDSPLHTQQRTWIVFVSSLLASGLFHQAKAEMIGSENPAEYFPQCSLVFPLNDIHSHVHNWPLPWRKTFPLLYCQFDGGARGYAINTNPVFFFEREWQNGWHLLVIFLVCVFLFFFWTIYRFFIFPNRFDKRSWKKKNQKKKKMKRRKRCWRKVDVKDKSNKTEK